MPSKQHNKRIAFVLVLLVITASVASYILYNQPAPLSASTDSEQTTSALAGKVRPSFSLPDMEGKQRDISEWDGKVLVINFWASWCKPCLREIPDFIRLQDQYGKDGLQFIGIAIDELEPVRHFLEKLDQPVNYPVLIAENDAISIAKQYGNVSGVLPYTVIVDRNKMTSFTQYGAFDHASAEQQILKIMNLAG